MKQIFLVHWQKEEVQPRLDRLRRAGFRALHWDCGIGKSRRLTGAPPSAYVIDLSRLPSHGREVAMVIRQRQSTRHVPIVFVDGQADKVKTVRVLFPDATFCTWPRIKSAMSRAIRTPPKQPVVPRSPSGPFSGTPLAKKLGINDGMIVAIINAPRGFEKTLGSLPRGVRIFRNRRESSDLTIWFVLAHGELELQMDRIAKRTGDGHLWIAWPKKSSGVETDLSDAVIRKAGLTAGLVEYKVCAIDETWSGLKFCRRRK